MRYLILSREACAELADQRLSDPRGSYGDLVRERSSWVGDGDTINLAPIQEAAQAIRNAMPEVRQPSELDQVEGRAAPYLYSALADIPVEVLDDQGFWRYLSLTYFWDFIEWRERKPFLNRNHMKYLDGESSTEAVLPRMYLRVAALGGFEYAELASTVRRGVDLWRSHVLRVRTGTAPALTRALIRYQERNQLNRDAIRELAKRLTRMWTNTVLHIYDDSEAETLLVELGYDLIDGTGQDS